MRFVADSVDVCVVGAGHAGIEAALAAARLGCRVALLTLNLDSVGNMPCNPCIGGTAKGQLVRERSTRWAARWPRRPTRPPCSFACWAGERALRCTRRASSRTGGAYQESMKRRLEKTPGLLLRQGEVVELLTEGGAVSGVLLRTGAVFLCRAVIVACGTYLGGKVFLGDVSYESGPDGLFRQTPFPKALRSTACACAASRRNAGARAAPVSGLFQDAGAGGRPPIPRRSPLRRPTRRPTRRSAT